MSAATVAPGATVGVEAQRRARDLLRSLLDDGQRVDYDRTGGFWVPTPRGPVRLGGLAALVHRPVDQPGIERILCVVPTGHHALPRADVWTSLLLTLAVDPDAFFRVAVLPGVRSRRGGRPAPRDFLPWTGERPGGQTAADPGARRSRGEVP